MDVIRDEVTEQALIVRDDEDCVMFAAEGIDAIGDDAQRVDVQSRICLVEDGQIRIEHGHLEDLVPLLLTT